MLYTSSRFRAGGASAVGAPASPHHHSSYEKTLLTIVFNRANPESTIGDAVIPNNEQYKYRTLIQEGGAFTLQRPEAAPAAGNKAAIALMRTPENNRDDMPAVSILYYNDDGTHYFNDFVVACEVSAVGDDSAVKGVAYDPQRLTGGFNFVDKNDSGFNEEDLIVANHYILAGDIPHPTPEPATATLSLLALAALAARRKRHSSE